jgi:hypothetical protein
MRGPKSHRVCALWLLSLYEKTSRRVKIPSGNLFCIHSIVLPPDTPSIELVTPIQGQSNDAKVTPFPALPMHSSVCEETMHSP